MPKNKKSRKVGRIGVRKSDKPRVVVSKEDKKPKNRTGRPSGSRHSQPVLDAGSPTQRNKDPRLGSKKPVPLIVEDKPLVAKPKHFSPKQELKHIENDTRLNVILDKLDNDVNISADDQAYADKKLARHKVLCDLLGIQDEEEEQESVDSDDLYDKFQSIDLDDYKH